MPTYEYQCEKCRKTFEMYQSMKDQAVTSCPKELCRQKTWGKGKVRRLVGTGAGLIFKGSGFYITDYRSEGYKSAAQKESGSGSSAGGESSTAGSTSGAADSAKSAPKPEGKPAAPEKKTKRGGKEN